MKFVTVCGCGLGTCLLLKMTAESALKQLGVKAEVVHSDLGSATSIECDMFIVTTDMEPHFKAANKKYIAIKNVADVNDMKQKLEPYVK
ncbi:MAG: ascorbate system component [Thermoanaerobacteraceae bacterium]|nr:ascorbate system component [Thermoanaerobacteraceae bacterium]